MPLPVMKEFSELDIINDYKAYKDKKSVAKRYCISTKQVTEIFNNSINKEAQYGFFFVFCGRSFILSMKSTIRGGKKNGNKKAKRRCNT